MPMPDEYTDEEAPFVAEPLFVNGTRVYTLDQGLRLMRLTWGPDNGLTESQARYWAALFGQAPALFTFISRISASWRVDSALAQEAARLLADCEPKPKGKPFKRTHDGATP